MNKANTEFEHARQQAINLLQNMDCEDVVRSILFVLGDYGAAENKEEARKRANCITGILYYVASTTTLDDLKYVYSFARAAAMAKEERGKGGAV